MFEGLIGLFRSFSISWIPENGSLDGRSASNYYELREMMYLLAEKAKWRRNHDGRDVPPHIEGSMRQRFRSVFVEGMLPGLSKKVAKHGEVGDWMSDFIKILGALLNYPIRRETSDVVSRMYTFPMFLEQLEITRLKLKQVIVENLKHVIS